VSRRVGILGGTFNPIHLGHLRSADEIAERLGLERVLFIPSSQPPHKPRTGIAPARDRLQMVRLAVRGNPRFLASAMEIERGGRSYSVETLRRLRRQLGANTELYFFVGLDAFSEIDSWKDYRELFSLANLVVTSRPPERLPPRPGLLPPAVRRQFRAVSKARWLHASGKTVVFLPVTDLDISASEIRRRLARGQSVRYLVPAAVERFLVRRRLYRR
jgi:nicotinate-nucleotide adenylyltransferase